MRCGSLSGRRCSDAKGLGSATALLCTGASLVGSGAALGGFAGAGCAAEVAIAWRAVFAVTTMPAQGESITHCSLQSAV